MIALNSVSGLTPLCRGVMNISYMTRRKGRSLSFAKTAHLFFVLLKKKKSHIVWEHQEGIIVGVCFWFFMENVVWICSVSWSGLFSVTVLMSHNYSVLKCLCLVFTTSETDQSETRDWVQGPGADATVSEKPESGNFKNEKPKVGGGGTAAGDQPPSTTCLCLGSKPTAWWWFPTNRSGTVSAAEMQTPRCEYELKDLFRFLRASSVWLGGGSGPVGSYFLASWKGCWPFEHRRERTLIISHTQGLPHEYTLSPVDEV